MDLLLGAHFSIAGGLDKALFRARDLGCNAAQIFTKNARSWAEPVHSTEQIQTFKAARVQTKVLFVASHCTYLINIAATDPIQRRRSLAALRSEMARSGALGLDVVVLHPGAHLGQGIEVGLDMARRGLMEILDADDGSFPRLLLETTAGSGTTLGSSFEQLATLIQGLGAKVGICLDTSHAFAAGYDLRTPDTLASTLTAFDRHLGLDRLELLHLNDSLPPLGSFKDRHAHIGQGRIGQPGFRALMKAPDLARIPKIIETPKTADGILMDPVNLGLLRQLAD